MTTALLISGGVDSAVACHLLVSRGIRPHLFHIRIVQPGESPDCTAEEDIELSRLTARRYDLPLSVVDLSQAYRDRVTDYVIRSLRLGLTPNPDALCNPLIKFGAFEETAGKDFDAIATGHYAQSLTDEQDRRWLLTSPDPVKDQTDFLSRLTPAQLRKAVFPIGHLKKAQVRAIADEQHLPSAHRRDSQGLCFLGRTGWRDHVRRYLGEKQGAVIEQETGKQVGTHRGHWFHTVGQRKGLGLGGGPWFVTDKDTERNIIFVTHAENYLLTDSFRLIDFRFPGGDPFEGAARGECLVKIRHTEAPVPATFQRLTPETWEIHTHRPLLGVAPGQFGVIYSPDLRICAGSGELRPKRQQP